MSFCVMFLIWLVVLIWFSRIINLLFLKWVIRLVFCSMLDRCLLVILIILLLKWWLWLLFIFLKLFKLMNIKVMLFFLWLIEVSSLFSWKVIILWFGKLVRLLNMVIFFNFVVFMFIWWFNVFSFLVNFFVVLFSIFSLFDNYWFWKKLCLFCFLNLLKCCWVSSGSIFDNVFSFCV